uniref:Uncharacterized protein n=1 Tax=Ciona intestinalis TaxID=7719 RepID=H2XX43_CIOIN
MQYLQMALVCGQRACLFRLGSALVKTCVTKLSPTKVEARVKSAAIQSYLAVFSVSTLPLVVS